MSDTVSRPDPDPAANVAPAGEVAPAAPRSRIARRWWLAGIAIAALVVIVLAPLASHDPDGLERVAQDQGFIGNARNMISGLFGGYEIPGISDPVVSTVLSGLLGVGIVLLAMYLLGRVLARRRS
jgi:hypothetical protein